jgi:predicted SnoaL-like aldol condensation-catalyzing enzyme
MIHSKRLSAALLTGLLGVAMPFASTQAATYSKQEQANIKVVADFYAALDRGDADGDLKKKIRAIAEQYLAPDYFQHVEAQRAYGPGREGFIKMFEHMPAMPAPPAAGAPPAGAGGPAAGAPPAGGPPTGALPPAKVLALMADGDLVVRISSRSMPGVKGDSFIFNMFRVKDGKLAEHWDASSGSMMMPGRAPGPDASAIGGRSN